MEVSSTYRYAKISAFKAREVTRAIQGLPVSAALDIVAFSPKKAAAMIGKTRKARSPMRKTTPISASTDGGEGSDCGRGPNNAPYDDPRSWECSTIRKRSSHIRIVLTDEIEIKRREKKAKGAAA